MNNCYLPKTCPCCENGTVDCGTGKVYCLDVSSLRMTLLGPRRVAENHCCSKWNPRTR